MNESVDMVALMNSYRRFPNNTCPASRHAEIIATCLIRDGDYPRLREEPEHCGGSIASVVASLFASRTENEILKSRIKKAIQELEEVRGIVVCQGMEGIANSIDNVLDEITAKIVLEQQQMEKDEKNGD